MLLLWKIKLVLTVNIYFDVSCATNVEIVPRRYFKCNLQTWIALYILQLLAIFYLCVISTLICLGHSFYKDHIQVRRVVIKAIIFQPEYNKLVLWCSPFTNIGIWHYVKENISSVCDLLKLGRLLNLFIILFLFLSINVCQNTVTQKTSFHHVNSPFNSVYLNWFYWSNNTF